jgi:hypothetical protein
MLAEVDDAPQKELFELQKVDSVKSKFTLKPVSNLHKFEYTLFRRK